jgi:hypothetical protein
MGEASEVGRGSWSGGATGVCLCVCVLVVLFHCGGQAWRDRGGLLVRRQRGRNEGGRGGGGGGSGGGRGGGGGGQERDRRKRVFGVQQQSLGDRW